MNIRSVYIFMALLASTSQNLPFSAFLNPDSLDKGSALCKISACTGKHKLARNKIINPHFVYYYRCSY
jgi:hypothetical protein